MLVASMNPSPSGFFNDPDAPQTSSPHDAALFKQNFGTIVRSNRHPYRRPVPFEKLSDDRKAESSVDIRKRVPARFEEMNNIHYNAQIYQTTHRILCTR
jgi:magnesium chelatase family protein